MFNVMARHDKSCSIFYGVFLYAIILSAEFDLHQPSRKKQIHRKGMYHQGQQIHPVLTEICETFSL